MAAIQRSRDQARSGVAGGPNAPLATAQPLHRSIHMKAPLPTHHVISAKAAQDKFDVARNVEYPFSDFGDEQEQRVYAGGLHVKGDFEGEDDVDWQPYNVIVDGDLIVDGSIDWFDYAFSTGASAVGSLEMRSATSRSS